MPLKLVTGSRQRRQGGRGAGRPPRAPRRGPGPGGARPSPTSSTPSASWPSAGAIFGARVLRFEWLFGEIAARAGFAGRPRVRLPARADRRGGGAPGAARACSPSPPPSPASCARRRDFFAELGRLAWSSRRASHPGAARLGRRRPAPAVRRGDRGDLPRLPRGPRGRRARGRRAVRLAARSTRCAASPRGWGAHARVRLRLRRLRPAPARRARDAGRPLRRGRDGLAAVRARPARVQGRGRRAPGAARARRARSWSWRRSTTTTRPSRAPALHHVERSLFEDDADEPVDAGRGGRVPLRRRRARRGRAGRRALLDLLRDGIAPGDVAVVFRDPTAYSSLLEQVFGAYGIPYSIDRSRAARPHGARPRAARAHPLRRRPGRRGRRPARLPAHARPARSSRASPTASRPRSAARARTPPPRRARCWEREHWTLEELDRLARARDTAPSLAELERQLARLFAAPYRRQRRRPAAARSWTTRASSSRRRRRSPSCARVRRADPRPARAAERAARAGASSSARWASRPSRTACRWPIPGRSARAASRRSSCCGLQEGEFPRGASPEPFLPDDDRRAIATASGLRAARARGPARPRALPVLRLLLARRAAARAQLAASSDEEGNPQTRVVLRRGRARPARRTAPSAARARCPRSPGRPRTRPRPRSGTARSRPPARGAARRRPARSAPSRCSSELAAPRRRGGPRARELRRLPGQMAGREPAEAGGAHARSRGDGARLLRPRGAPPHLRAAGARRPASRRVTHGNLARRRANPDRGAARPELVVPAVAEADARARRGAPARVRPAALPPPRGRLGQPVRARSPRAATSAMGESEPVELDGGPARARPDRPRGRVRRHGARDRLQDRQARGPLQGGELGAGEPLPGRALHARRREAARPPRGGRRVRGARQQGPAPARHGGGGRGRARRRAGSTRTACRRDEFREKLDWALGRIRETDAQMRAGELRPAPDRATGTAAASTRRCAGASDEGAHAGAARGRSRAATAR